MPRIPRGGQIVTLQSAREGAVALTDVHSATYSVCFAVCFNIISIVSLSKWLNLSSDRSTHYWQ